MVTITTKSQNRADTVHIVPGRDRNEQLISPKESDTIELLIDGIADGPSGFAVHLRDWARHLSRFGIRVFVPENRATEYTEIQKMKINPNANGFKPIELLNYSGGNFHSKNPDRAVIGYTVFETDQFPKSFRDSARNVDLLWTPSNFCYDRLAQVGIPREKMEIIPEGVDTCLFSPYSGKSLKYNKGTKFIFGIICGWSERKGIDTLLNAFLKEFNRDEAALYISGGWYAEKVAREEIRIIKERLGKANYPDIILDWTQKMDWEMPAIFNSLDCYVLPTKGEGYNRTVVEAMSCEIPTISTDYPPTSEILNSKNGYPIKVERLGPEPRADWICDLYKGANFAHPSEEHLRSLMREVYEHRDEAKAKAVIARNDIKREHNVTEIVEKVIKRLIKIKEEYYRQGIA